MRAEWNGKVMELKPLAAEDTNELLRATLPLHDGAVARASEQSRGNPLFALQLLHAWAGGGYLKMEDGQYRVPVDALQGRAITTAELWDERLRAVPTELRLSAYAAAALGEDIRGVVLKALVASLGMDPRDAMVALTRAQILLASGNDQFRWPHALLQEHLMQRLHERNDAPAIFRLAANALAKHPAVGSRRIMKHRVTNLLRAGDDDIAAQLMFQFIAGSWRRGRDTAATLRDTQLLEGRVTGPAAAEYSRWRAEALRHIGRLEDAREQADMARRAFEQAGDARERGAGAPPPRAHRVGPRRARAGRLLGRRRARALRGARRRAGQGAGAGGARRDRLPARRSRPRARRAARRQRPLQRELGDVLGRAQCLIPPRAHRDGRRRLPARARAALMEARRVRSHRLPAGPGPVRHRARLTPTTARSTSTAPAPARSLARAAFRELSRTRAARRRASASSR